MSQTPTNKYFFVSGIISVILSAAHAWWGITHVIPELSRLNSTAMASFEISYHQVGATLFIGGVALLIHTITRQESKTIPALVLSIYFFNFSLFLVLIYLKYPFIMVQTVTQQVLFAVMLVFLFLGLWNKPMSARDDVTRRNIKYLSVLNFRHKE